MSATLKKPTWIVGIDEVGRGPLAGPVTVCAVAMPLILYKKMKWKGLNDSKLMTAKNRDAWNVEAMRLHKEGKIIIALSSRTAKSIDEKGISVCIHSCIGSILKKISLDPSDCLVLLDGSLHAPSLYIHQQTVIKGDRIHKIISLASVVAKVSRDRYMKRLHNQHPEYAWAENKGYGTRAHGHGLIKYGPTKWHRKTYIPACMQGT